MIRDHGQSYPLRKWGRPASQSIAHKERMTKDDLKPVAASPAKAVKVVQDEA